MDDVELVFDAVRPNVHQFTQLAGLTVESLLDEQTEAVTVVHFGDL
jgi:hypothetical protein